MSSDLFLRTENFPVIDELVRSLESRVRGLDGLHGLSHAARRSTPEVHITESAAAFELSCDLPGLTADALEVSAEGDTVTIAAHYADAAEDGWRAVLQERPRAGFQRSVRFRRSIHADLVSASLTDGVLRVNVPLRAPTVVPVHVQS